MITVMTLLHTKVAITDQVLAANSVEIRRQAQSDAPVTERVFNHVIGLPQSIANLPLCDIVPDAIGQFHCRDLSAGLTAADAGGLDLSMGLGHIVESTYPVVCLQNEVLPPPPAAAGKQMILLRKQPQLSSEVFQEQCFNVQALLLKRLPALLGCRQHLVIDGPRNEADQMIVDGVMELWLEPGMILNDVYQSAPGLTAVAHANEFIAAVSAFSVNPLPIH